MQSPFLLNLMLDQARTLLAHGRAEQAVAITAPLANDTSSLNALSLHSRGLKALGRHAEALGWDSRAVERFPQSAIGWHNLAATLGDLGRGAEAVAAADAAFGHGLDAPETWLVYARALVAVSDLDAGQAAYREALRRAPGDSAMASELAELVWTASGSLPDALTVLDEAVSRGVTTSALAPRRAGLLLAAEQTKPALAVLSAATVAAPGDTALRLAYSDLLLKQAQPLVALEQARVAAGQAPSNAAVLTQLSFCQMAVGHANEAMEIARAGLSRAPHSQGLLCAQAMASRLIGEAVVDPLNDYDRVVATYRLPCPQGWVTLDAYLADLAQALANAHVHRSHPSDQSLHGGSQTGFRLTGASDPVIQAFFRAVDEPIQAHLALLGSGDDPLRRRNTGGYRIHGAWSVRLRPGGYHRDHFHSEGWLSSAFYVETPEVALDREGGEGWLRLGQPPFRTMPPLSAERHIRPAPGTLVLFPSSMWHGTAPFTTDERRMTIAFDLVPA